MTSASDLKKYNLESTHVEIIKRSQVILEFLIAQQQLTTAHIDLLWIASEMEDQVRQVYMMTVELAQKLPEHMIAYLYRKYVAKLDPEQYGEHTIQLIKGLSYYGIWKQIRQSNWRKKRSWLPISK